jgi:hypothetical protein
VAPFTTQQSLDEDLDLNSQELRIEKLASSRHSSRMLLKASIYAQVYPFQYFSTERMSPLRLAPAGLQKKGSWLAFHVIILQTGYALLFARCATFLKQAATREVDSRRF